MMSEKSRPFLLKDSGIGTMLSHSRLQSLRFFEKMQELRIEEEQKKKEETFLACQQDHWNLQCECECLHQQSRNE